MTSKTLSERWRTETGQVLAEEVVARLAGGRSLDGLGLAEHDGRIDLRGLPAPVPRRLQRFESQGWFVEKLGDLVKFRGVQLEGLDLSGAQLQSFRFHDSQIADCRLDGANCLDWRFWASEVTDTSFRRANLHDAVVGTWHEGRCNAWRRVDFSSADFRVAVSEGALYEDCDFSDAKLAKVQFSQCALVRCRFAGKLRGVLFDGRELEGRPPATPMDNVDFSAAVFEEVEFQGFDLRHVVLPDDPDVRVFHGYRCVAEHALEALQGTESVPARMMRRLLERRLHMMRSGDEAELFNRRDYLTYGGKEFADLAENLLSKAEAACRSS